MKRLMMPWLALLMLAGGCQTGRQPAFVEPWDTLPRLEGIALDYARAHQIDFDFSNTHPEAGTKETTDVAYLYFYHAKDLPYYRFKIDRDGQVLQAGLMVPAAIDRRPSPLVATIKPPGPPVSTNAAASTSAPAQAAPPAPPPGAVQATVESQPATEQASAGTAPGMNASEMPKRPHSPMAQELPFARYNCAISIPGGYQLREKPVPDTNVVAIFDNDLARSRFMIMVLDDHHYEGMNDSLVAGMEQEYKSHDGNDLVSGKFITVAGQKAYERVAWAMIDKKRASTLAYVLCAEGKMYCVEGMVFKGDISDYPEIRTALDSFRFLRPPAAGAGAATGVEASLRSGLAAYRITRRLGIVVGAVLGGIALVGALLSRLRGRSPR